MGVTCVDCKHHRVLKDPLDKEEKVFCCRYPPVQMTLEVQIPGSLIANAPPMAAKVIISRFPETDGMWCGEFDQ